MLIPLFFFQIAGCKKHTTTIIVQDNIVLSSDENINWSDYITIKVDDETKDLKDATITLLSGDSNSNGICTYEVLYTYKKKEYRQTFDVTFEYPKRVPTFEIKEDIVLTSNQNIDWNQYITIKVNGNAINLADASIQKQSGDSSASGVCSYRVTYLCDEIEYSEDFNVTYQYPTTPTTEKVKPDIKIAENITLTSNQNIDWSQYITIKVNNTSISLDDVAISLVSGNDTISGSCAYKLSYTYNNDTYNKIFIVKYQYPTSEKATPTFEIANNITLTSNQNIDWSKYITIKLDNTPVDISKSSILLMSGDETISGTCSYKIIYNYERVDYTETFTVTYQYPNQEKVTPTFEIANNIILTSNQNIDWNKYITIKVNNIPVNLDNATISLVTGTETVSGTCSYKITYTYENVDYEETFNVTYQYPIEEHEIGNIQNQAVNTSCEVTGVIVAITSKGILLKDLNAEEYVYVFCGVAVTNQLYDVVKVSGTITSFGGKNQITSPTITDLNQNNPVTLEPIEYTAELVDAYATTPTVGVPAKITGTLTISKGKYYNVAVTGASTTVSICYPTQDLTSLDGSEVTFSGYFIYISSGYANIAVVGDVKATSEIGGGSTVIEPTTLTDEQIATWNTAINKDYNNIIIFDSLTSLQQKQYNGLYHQQTFDQDARVEMNYYKYINNALNTYTYTGWKPITNNPLIQFNLELLKNIDATAIKFQEFDTGFENVTGIYVIDTTTLTAKSFIPSWTSLNAKYFAFAIDAETNIAKIYAICEDGGKTVYHFVQVSLLNEASAILDPETSCNEVSILEIQDMAGEQLCTTTGIVVAHTKTGYLIGDPNNEFSYVYLNTGTTPIIAINNEVKVFGVISIIGSSLQFNDASTLTITDLGAIDTTNPENPKIVKYNPDYIEAAEFLEYGESPFSGYEVQFIATISTPTKLLVENLNFDVTIIDPITDYTPYLNQKMMIKGYILYSITTGTEEKPIYSFYLIVKEVSNDTTNPTIRILTIEEQNAFSYAIGQDYSNVTITENITYSTTYITSEGIKVTDAVDENENVFDYQLRYTGSAYQYSEDGINWETISEAEYLSLALIIYFNMIDETKVVYNTRDNLYQISPNDLAITNFIPYFSASTILNIQFKLSEDGHVATIALTEIYDNYIYVDCLYLSDYGTTTLAH